MVLYGHYFSVFVYLYLNMCTFSFLIYIVYMYTCRIISSPGNLSLYTCTVCMYLFVYMCWMVLFYVFVFTYICNNCKKRWNFFFFQVTNINLFQISSYMDLIVLPWRSSASYQWWNVLCIVPYMPLWRGKVHDRCVGAQFSCYEVQKQTWWTTVNESVISTITLFTLFSRNFVGIHIFM